ncbi:MAG: response regulator [Deferribacterales bacterium]
MNTGKIADIIIVEDDIKLAGLLKSMLEASSEYNCLGVVDSFEQCVSLLKISQPDIIVVDIDLSSETSGIEIIRYVSENCPDTEVLVHTVHEDNETLFEALRMGASGYILKSSSPLEFLTYLKQMQKGEVPISPKIARRILSFFNEQKQEECEPLSSREIEVLRMADKGYTYKQIADLTGISRHTVHAHLKQVYFKLHVTSKTEALKKARKMTLL